MQERVVPALEALLAAALERDELLGDVVETRALRRSDVLKTALLRAVSHDLRTPLTAIITAAEPLARRARRRRRARASSPAASAQEAERLSRLIDNLLDLSRLEAHAAEPRPDWCSLDEVLRAAADEVATPAEFSFALDAELPLVRADAAQLERAFANLLENSARHAGGHPVSVRARPVARPRPGPHRRPRPGHPASQLERVFEPFYRSGNERTGHRGSGLGLAIARGFVEVNGGEGLGGVAARPGHVVRRRAPARAGAGAAPRWRERPRRASSSATTSRRSCARCGVVLRDAGFDVVPAATAAEALDAAALRAPDAAILDLVLPDGDGIEVTRQLREWTRAADPRAVGRRRGGAEGPRAGGGRRRLRDQAVQPARARRAPARGAAARAPGRGRARAARPASSSSTSPPTRCGAAGEDVHLTPIEFRLLAALMSRTGRLLTHGALLTEVWGPAYADDVATLRTHIANLRRKVEPDDPAPRHIRTDAGVGYRFVADARILMQACLDGAGADLARRRDIAAARTRAHDLARWTDRAAP